MDFKTMKQAVHKRLLRGRYGLECLLWVAKEYGKRVKEAEPAAIYLGETEVGNKTIFLYRSNAMVFLITKHLPHMPCAAVSKIQACMYSIVVNDGWEKLPANQKRGILAHELAHVQLGHVSSVRRALASKLKRTFLGEFPYELEADELAVKAGHGPGLIMALFKLRKRIKNTGGNTKEADVRIRRIKKLLMSRKDAPTIITLL